ncbi:uncharacterized protein J3R85_002906 [Psidium guajava]|nr:uncharacterized protein J3R85_002906 [Psidium guajava]
MAPNAIPKFATLAILVLLATSSSSEATFNFNQKLKETKLVFYMFDWETGLNITTVPVTGIPGNWWWILGFGTIFAIDDKLTEFAPVDVACVHQPGVQWSTLEIQGSDRFYNKYREVSVVSGTGKFRFARGYAFLETLLLDQVNSNAIIRWNVTVYYHY